MARSGLRADVHPDGLRCFIAECQANGCSAITISGYCWAIWKLLRLIRSKELSSLDWLYDTCCNLDEVARVSRKCGARRKVDTAELTLVGEKLIARARELAGIRAEDVPALVCRHANGELAPGWRHIGWDSVQAFRDGLIFLVGPYAPERRRALVTIELDQINFGQCTIEFTREQTKTKKQSSRLLPAFVMDRIVEWIAIWHSQYQPEHKRLWIAKGGRPLKAEAMYAAVTKASSRVLGFSVSPHDFRDAAATLVVEEAPHRSRLATIILDHTSEQMTRNYTEQANQISASRALVATIARRKEATTRAVRERTQSTTALNPRSKRRQRRKAHS